ncbi:hypothetical protein N658DRAFT_300882 [Parathielavia hyrcaniae]|uniref:Uncharacterized protein n=1 Tax=Parathielavia hyrcaniae TaxID=113614 RepID=A0AAN6Q3V8_9PEZI|nr:hypothetical protein N658DRAFT_300882 [Parathielavia hyrcaniae]
MRYKVLRADIGTDLQVSRYSLRLSSNLQSLEGLSRLLFRLYRHSGQQTGLDPPMLISSGQTPTPSRGARYSWQTAISPHARRRSAASELASTDRRDGHVRGLLREYIVDTTTSPLGARCPSCRPNHPSLPNSRLLPLSIAQPDLIDACPLSTWTLQASRPTYL